MKYCKLKPEDINDSTIETYIEKLKKYEIWKWGKWKIDIIKLWWDFC